jgi:predicted ATPase/GAF domain-containing protein/anti-anti-sigma regulatory factor/tRNA A-37 threonylcarbamoyl transferase component Bud32
MLHLDSYTVSERIHEGATTAIYRGRRLEDGARVVLKVLKNDYPSQRDIARLRHEHAILADLKGAGVVKTYGLEPHGNGFALVLEDLGDQSLYELIRKRRVDLRTTLQVGSALAAILDSLHEQHIVHKDIKPRNVLLRAGTHEVVLTDLGIATRLSRESCSAKRLESLEGTLAYMSPEQTGRMNRSIDTRTDLYSLGVVLYEMLTGVLPFQTTDPIEIAHSHLARTPAPVHDVEPDMPRAVSDIVMKLLSKAAEDRYQRARGLKVDLDECLSQLEATGQIAPFPLGRRDQTGELRISQKLYGREADLAALADAFESTSRGAATLLLVSGPAGVGKTALVHEVHKSVTRSRGYFVEGKFEERTRGIPYAPFAQAFRELIQQILTERTKALETWKNELLAAVGPHGQLLIDLVPELELVIGPQPSTKALGPAEAQNRFTLAVQDLLRVFARADHPLVIFLDDLQCVDPASLKLLQIFFSDPASAYILVIGAYRDDEVDKAHPLWLAVDEIKSVGAGVREIAVEPLSLSETCQLLCDTLSCDTGHAQRLAAVIFERTHGNPFFLNQFLQLIHEAGMLTFDVESASWRWDLKRIPETVATDNVVALMAEKLGRVGRATQRLLTLASCIGYHFDLKLLSLIDDSPQIEVVSALSEALREGLILTLDPEYRFLQAQNEAADSTSPQMFNVSCRFLHARVQQAAYSLLDDERKKEIHLRIGRLLLAASRNAPRDKELLDTVYQLNLGAELIEARPERVELARLNLAAGKKARDATAYEAAAQYFASGMALLEAESWNRDYDLTYALHADRAECECMSGQFEQAKPLFDVVLQHAKSDVERAEIYNQLVLLYSRTARWAEAVDAGRSGLSVLGIDLPLPEDAQAAAGGELAQIAAHLANRRIEEFFDAPAMTAPDKQIALQLLANLFSPIYAACPSLLLYLSAKPVNISLQHGHSDVAAFAYINYGFTLAMFMGRYQEAYEFSRLAFELNKKFPNVKITGQVNFMFAAGINIYRNLARASLPAFRRAIDAGLESGDFVNIAYVSAQIMMLRLGIGDELDAVREEADRQLAMMTRIKGFECKVFVTIAKQAAENLQGRTRDRSTLSDATFDEAETVAQMDRMFWGFSACFYFIVKLELLFLHEDYAGALSMAEQAERRIASNLGMYSTTELPFYLALTLAALYPAAPPDERQRHAARLAEQKAKLAALSDVCPVNFRQKLLLVEAEAARISGDAQAAADLYDRAIDAAQENGFLHYQAIASELCARFYLGIGKRRIARLYMTDAHHGYLRWGATAKADDIASKHPDLLIQNTVAPTATDTLSVTTARVPAELLDLTAILQTTQAIASELILDKVLDQWMRIVIKNAGAQRGHLILSRNNQLFVEASITVDPDTIRLGLSTPVETAGDLPLSLVQYVARTRKPLVLVDAARESRFAADPYIVARQPRSILCLAMMHQGRLTGILYLENNIAQGAFTRARLELLGLLASQAAIAVENAYLYSDVQAHVQTVTAELRRANETLEQEVAARTSELSDANERLRLELVERARSEREHAALQEEVIRVQDARLAELSSPLIPISDRLMVMPLIGTMDAQRAQQVLETALNGVQSNQTQVVIIDITGVKQVDESVASTLLKTAQGLRLLGTEVVLTGFSPEVARTLVDMDVDLHTITTRGTLQSGIAYAMARVNGAQSRNVAPGTPNARPLGR